MATVTHAKVSAKADGGDATLVLPSDWNAGHTIVGDIPYGFIGARVHSTATQSVATATGVLATFNTEDFDTDGFHSTVTNTSRMTIPTGLGGKYLLTGYIYWGAGLAGVHIIRFFKNGAALSPQVLDVGSAVGLGQVATTVLDLVAGDYVEINVYHQGGSNETIGDAVNAEQRNSFAVTKLDAGQVGSGVGASAYKTTDQTGITTVTAALFDAENFDTDGFHSTSSNTNRFTVPAGLGGKYLLSAYAYATLIAANTNYLHVRIRNQAGATLFGDRHARSPDDNTIVTVSGVVNLSAGDWVEMSVESDDASFSLMAASAFSIMRLDSLPQPTYPVGYEYDYVQFTSNVSITATSAATANTVVTGNAVTYDGSTIVIIEFYLVAAQAGTTDVSFSLWDGSTDLGRIAYVNPASTYNQIKASHRLTPSAASHAYSVRGFVTGGTGTAIAGTGGAGTNMPGYIRVTKV